MSFAAGALAIVLSVVPGARTAVEDSILARSEKVYASLKSYSDTGNVLYEYGTDSVSRHTFRTYFRVPRHLYFEFNEDSNDGGNRLVLWGEGENFQVWESDSGVHNVYPKGKGRSAFLAADHPTNGVASVVAALLFPTAGLGSVIGEIAEIAPAGAELVDRRSTHKLTGIARSMYGTGHVFNERRVAVWIDAETLLIRKVFQDTPKGYGTPGTRRRITMTFDPQTNPALDDNRFRFVPPSRQGERESLRW